MGFDVLGARNDGYTDDEIADYLAQQRGFNITGARDDGYSSTEIIDHLVPSMGGAEQASPQPSDPGFWNQLSGTFVDTVRQSNPELLGWAAEGLGTVSGLDTVSDLGGYLQKEFKDNPTENFVPRIQTYKQVEDLETLIDYAGQGIGQAAGSFVVPIATGATGAVVGSVAGPTGAVAGGIAGAASGSFALNYGETFKFLVEEQKVDRGLAAKIAVVPGALMAGLDTLGLTKIVKPLAGLTSKKIAKNIVKRAIQLGGRGYTIEALTEAAQDIIKNITGEITEATGASPEDIQFAQRLESTINSFLIGGFGGGAISVATSPFVSPTPEEKVQALPDVTEGLPETLDEETVVTLEEETADGAEQSLTEAEIAPEAQDLVSTEVAQDELETAVTAPESRPDFVTEEVDTAVDATVPPVVEAPDVSGLPAEDVNEQLRQVGVETPPEGPPPPDIGGLDLEVSEPASEEFQTSALETLAPVEYETLDVSSVANLQEAARTATPKQSTPPHIQQKIIENLNRRLQARGLADDIALVVTDTIFRPEMGANLEAAPSQAKYVPRTESAKGAIILALDALPESSLKKPKEMATYLAGLTDHETVHSWVDLGIINDSDMQALAKAAALAPHWSDPNKTVADVIGEVYSDLDAEGQVEEAAAELFRGHAAGNVVLKGRPLSIWQRILNFFRNLKGGLAEADIYKAAQVFDRVGMSPDFVSAAPTAPADDFGDELVEAVSGKSLGEELRDEAPPDKEARPFHGGPNIWAPEPGKPFGVPQLKFIKTGEGAIVFGWGFYSGESRGVGANYIIQREPTISLDGVPLRYGAIGSREVNETLIKLGLPPNPTAGSPATEAWSPWYEGPTVKVLMELLQTGEFGYSPTVRNAQGALVSGGPQMPTDLKSLVKLTRAKIQDYHGQDPNSDIPAIVYDPAIADKPPGVEPGNIPPEVVAKSLADQMEALNRIAERLEFEGSPGYFVQLDVPDDAVAKFLDHDRPIEDQPEDIKRGVASVANAVADQLEEVSFIAEESLLPRPEYHPTKYLDAPNIRNKLLSLRDYRGAVPTAMTGGGFQTEVTKAFEILNNIRYDDARKLTSEALRDAGIPGLKYLDQDSRYLDSSPQAKGLATRLIDLTGSVDGAIAEAQARIADAQERGISPDSRFQVPEVLEILQTVGDPRTRNFVIWDQDVLNRVEVVGVNDVPVNQVAVNLSSATGSILGLKDLQEQANTGDIEAQRILQDVASDSLSYLLSGIPDARVLPTPAQGLYFGDLEPSIGLDVGFEEGSRKDVLAALAKFAQNFNQEQIHVRTGADENTDVGFTYPDGSYNTAAVRFVLSEPLSRQEVEEVISSSGLVGMTATDTYLDAYYVGDPSDAAAIQEFKQATGRASQSLEGRTERVDPTVQRLWAYGDGYGATNPYSDIRGPLRSPEANEANKTSWRIGQRLRGRPFTPVPSQQTLTPEQRDVQSEIADAFDDMPLNDLANPDVRRAYDALAKELDSQYRALPIKVEVFEGEGEPYANSAAMRDDINQNNHLFIYGTNADTFGPEGVVYDNHPMLKQTPYTDVNGYPLLVNDLLRAVHDYYAHTMAPNKFGPLGEEAAWQNHMRMTRSPWARWALTSETRGQNSWVNFHRLSVDPSKRADSLPITERPFSEQKTALLPIEYTMIGDPVIDQEMFDIAYPDKEARPINQSPRAPRLKMSGPRSFVMTLENDHIALVHTGETRPQKEGLRRETFTVYDVDFIRENLPPGQEQADLELLEQSKLGVADINFAVAEEDSSMTDTIEGIINLEVDKDKRGLGAGRKIIENLFANADNGLRVYDIQEKAKGFWKGLGVEITEESRTQTDGILRRSDVDILEEQLSAATSTDKEARRFTDLPPKAKKLIVAGYDTEGNATAKFGTIRHLGKDVPVVLPVGTPQDRGLLHVLSNEDHMHDFKYHTPYGWGPIRNERTTVKRALESLLKAYWNPELQAPRKGYAVADVTAETSRGRIRDDFVVLEWRDPASKYPIRAAFNLLDPAEVTGLQEPMFIMDTIFPVSGKENPAYQEARKELDNDGTVQLDNLSPAGRDAAIMAWKDKIKKDKLSRPISQEWSIKTKPTDMGVDIPSGIVGVQQHETLGEKFLTKLGMLGGTPLDSFGEFFTWFRRAHVDEWDPARRGDVALSEKDDRYSNFLSASSSAWSALRSARRGTAITAYALSKGVPVYKNGGTSVRDIPEDAQQTNIDGTTERSRIAGTSTGFIPIIEPLRKGNRFDPFQLYSIARRAARLIREGRERLLTQDQIAQYLAMGNTTAEIAQIMQVSEAEVSTLLGGRNIKYNDDFSNIFQDYQVWNGYFVDFLVDTGVLTREKADIWKETADYIPFYRQLDKDQEAIPGDPDLFNGLVAASPPPPLSGQGDIWAVIATDANKVSTSLPTTFRGKEKKQADAYAEKFKQETGMDVKVVNRGMPIGGFLETITENALSAVQTGMMNVGMQRVMRNMVLIDPIQTVKANHRPPGSVTFRVKGETLTLMVPDKALYSSLSNYLQNQSIPAWVNLLGMPARFLREMITRSPDFMAANMLRDSLSAWVTSGRKTGALAGTIGGFSQALRGSTSAEALASAGLMTGFDFGGDPTKMTQFIEKELLKYKYPSAVGRFIRNPLKGIWDATGKASRSSDTATRIAVYERVLKDTGDEVQAFWEAQEVINFSARGSSPLIQNLAVMIPFLNARIQGLDVLYRASMGRKGFAARPESDIVKRQFYLKALLVGMSSATYWALVHDDEEYINQNPEIKDNYWIIPASWIPGYDGPPLKIPIPFEVGFLFKTIPERVMALYFGKDVPRDITRSLRQGLINTFEFNPIPQAALPVLEVATNYSFWTGRKIEGNALEDAGMPGYRANSRTSSLAIKLGEELNYSPVKIDHMIRGYSGTLGTVLLDTVDGVIRDVASDLGERPAKQLSEYPFVKRFIARPDARGLVTQFYDLRRAVNDAVKTAKKLEKGELTFPKSEEFTEEYAHLLVLEDEVKVISGVLNELRARREDVMAQDISAEAKRKEIDEITAMELMAVESVPDLRQEAFQ